MATRKVSETVDELYLFLTPHIINNDEDIDKLRDAVQNGSELLKQIPTGPRFSPPRLIPSTCPNGGFCPHAPRAHRQHQSRARIDSMAKAPTVVPRRPPGRDTLNLLLPASG